MRLLIRWAISALSLFAAAWLVPGIHVDDSRGWVVYAVMAVVLSLVNALVRPLLKLLTCPLILLTLGLFTLVINGAMFWLASVISPAFQVQNLWAAILASVVVSVISALLSVLLGVNRKEED